MMKKSVMAAGVAALLGMSSAHAVYYFETRADFTTPASRIVANEDPATDMGTVQAGGIGHVLFTPYFSTAQGNSTLISLVNTDKNYGKVVKVRFRGAANSDDLLDFTVLLSPGDVWTGAVLSSLTGGARILSPDTSCVLPRQIPEDNPAEFREFRLDPKLSDVAKAVHRTEGYIEYLNMADISPKQGRMTAKDNALPPGSVGGVTNLFQSVKHVNNVAPCNQAIMDWLQTSDSLSKADALKYGLLPPTGGLFGNWAVFNNQSITSYGGGHYASAAKGGESARLVFAPQVGEAVPAGTDETADPLLRSDALTSTGAVFNGGAPAIPPLWVDLPDLSTPYTSADIVGGNFDPRARAFSLSQALSATTIMNEFVATPDSASVPFYTDWVFSQPTRRYQVAVSYSSSGSNTPVNAKPVFDHGAHYFVGNANSIDYGADAGKVTGNVTLVQRSVSGTSLGDFLCVQAPMTGSNREEGAISTTGDFSPVPVANAAALCGETATLSFNSSASKVLHSVLANQRVAVGVGAGGSTTVQAGWATLTLKPATTEFKTGGGAFTTPTNPATGLPVIGYSATAFTNGATNGNFGDAIEHRYTR